MSLHRVDVFRRWQEEEKVSVGRTIMKVCINQGFRLFREERETIFKFRCGVPKENEEKNDHIG